MAECATLVVLRRRGSSGAVDWGDLSRWLAESSPEDALVEVIRLTGLVLAWWLTATTVLYVLARLTRVPTLVRSVQWATLTPVRRMVDGLLATSIVAGSTFGSATIASAEPREPSPFVVQLGQQTNESEPARSPAYRPRPAGDATAVEPSDQSKLATPTSVPRAADVPPHSTPTPKPPPPGEAAPQSPAGSKPYVVQPDDSLWHIAEHHLAETTGRSSDEIGVTETRAYWARLVETNRHRLRSGDPDLILPDEEVVLPAVTDRQTTR